MKKVTQILFFLLLLLTASCSRQEYKIHHKETRAEHELQDLRKAILSDNMDSIWVVTHHSSDIHYLIFFEGVVVYWSDNSLTTQDIYVPVYDKWHDFDFSNARCRVLWQKIGDYDVEAIIPLEWHINANEEISQSFSYQPLLQRITTVEGGLFSSRTKARVFYWLMIAAFAALVITGSVYIIRARGFRNLRLSTKITFTIMMVVLLGFVAVFLVSVKYIRAHYVARQEKELTQKCHYIQAALQNIYVWEYTIEAVQPASLNVFLHDLAHSYATDIHIYDLQGRLVGSSTPQLFRHKLLSTYLAPEVLFSPQKTETCYTTLGDFRFLSAYSEFVNGAFVQLGYIAVPSFISEAEADREVEAFLARLLPVYLLVLIFGAMLAVGLSRALTAPMEAVGERLKNFSLSDKNSHIPYKQHDEMGVLVAHYNDMVDELARSSQQLARSEREGAWRTMARQIAHEINNPLTSMKLMVQQLQRLKGTDRFDAQFDKVTAMLITEMDNLSRIATSFSTFAKQPEVQPGEVDVAQKLSAVISLTSHNPQGTSIRYIGPDAGVMAYADKEQIGQVFTNIIRNAVQAINAAPDGDIIVILKDDAANPYIEITFSDNGPGIPEDVQPKIFLPNFTTKSTGAGLGLAISKNIIEGADGSITFESSPKGTTFRILLQRVHP